MTELVDKGEGRAARGLLISVGGSPAPVAYSIERHRPERIIFFASSDSRGEIETRVRPLLTHQWSDREVVTTPDPQDLTRCMEALADKLPECLANLGLSMNELVVDYTGGTKTMSAAPVLATINQPGAYSYVGGTVRSKEGLGTVLDGSEAVLVTPNPWDVLAVDLRRRIARRFNQARFAEARDSAAEAAYFQGYTSLFAGSLEFTGRNRRPPREPVNACLSLGYTLLHAEAVMAAHAAGLDPLLGFYHEPACGRESLASDLIEPLRPRVDEWVWTLPRDRTLQAENFARDKGACLLNKAGRQTFYRAFEEPAAHLRRYLRRYAVALAVALVRYAGDPLAAVPGGVAA